MNLHGYLARERVLYGSEDGQLDFTNIYFYTVLYHALRASNRIATRTGFALQGLRELEVRVGGVLRQVHRAGLGAQDPTRCASSSLMPGSPSRRRSDLGPAQGVWCRRTASTTRTCRPADRVDLHTSNSLHQFDPPGGEQDRDPQGRQDRPRLHHPAPYLPTTTWSTTRMRTQIGYEKIIDTYAAATQHAGPGEPDAVLSKAHRQHPRRQTRRRSTQWRQGHQDAVTHIRLRQMAWRAPRSRAASPACCRAPSRFGLSDRQRAVFIDCPGRVDRDLPDVKTRSRSAKHPE